MADERKARPVSGEIMTATPASAARAPADFIEAEYESVRADAVSVTDNAPETPSGIMSPAPSLAGMAMLRGEEPRARPAVRGGPLFWTCGMGLVAAAFWVSGGHALVRTVPFLAEQAPASAFSVSDVTSRVDVSGMRPVLFVDGQAVNDGGAPGVLPALAIVVTGNDGHVTRYRLGTSDQPMAPGERFAFSSRLDVPKNGVKTVSVIFAE